ncbi:MAG: nucleotidyltransferase domain-containing protein, partial [Eubacteriales bacterium]|nr:nucleotidyltransferase domain-containing protein [Eubacteriales bacterium]
RLSLTLFSSIQVGDMCEVITKKINNKEVRIADIKADYIENIVNSAALCDQINRIVLFGSSTEERCTESSDIDIAVFGTLSKARMFSSKGYKKFIQAIVSYGGVQDYDVLYFDDSKAYSDNIMSDISNGVLLYTKG